MSFSYMHADRRTIGQISGRINIYLPPLNKRYSPIISTMCGPNKAVEVDIILMERVVSNGFDTKHSNAIIVLYLFI